MVLSSSKRYKCTTFVHLTFSTNDTVWQCDKADFGTPSAISNMVQPRQLVLDQSHSRASRSVHMIKLSEMSSSICPQQWIFVRSGFVYVFLLPYKTIKNFDLCVLICTSAVTCPQLIWIWLALWYLWWPRCHFTVKEHDSLII